MNLLLPICLFAALSFSAVDAFAHKVIASVYVSGDVIEGEIGLSNGEMATGKVVTVFDQAGVQLGATKTDDDGFFVFKPVGAVTHIFKSNLGAGHVARAVLDVSDLSRMSFSGATATTATAMPSASQPGVSMTATGTVDRTDLAAMIRAEIKPLRREIAAYKEKNDMQTVLGGIGYILGIFGIGFYIAAKRKKDGS